MAQDLLRVLPAQFLVVVVPDAANDQAGFAAGAESPHRSVVALMWTDPAVYHATIFLGQVLSERGITLTILCRQSAPDIDVSADTNFGDHTTVIRCGAGHSGWKDKAQFIFYIIRACAIVRRQRPGLIIGYNWFGALPAYIARGLWPRARFIYHNFDLRSGDDLGFLGRQTTRLEYRAARSADQVVVSSPGRGRILKQAAGLQREPMSLFNCQRIVEGSVRTEDVRHLLIRQGFHFDRIVLYLGSIDAKHGLEATIRSVAEWSDGWGLLVVGIPEAQFFRDVQELVRAFDLDRRVVFLPSADLARWNGSLAAGDLGLALYEDVNVNHAEMAGASQKLNSYLKAGMPVVVSGQEDFKAFLERFPCGQTADPTDSRTIAAAVRTLLADDTEYARFSVEANRAFQTEYNFETQFDPLLQWMLAFL